LETLDFLRNPKQHVTRLLEDKAKEERFCRTAIQPRLRGGTGEDIERILLGSSHRGTQTSSLYLVRLPTYLMHHQKRRDRQQIYQKVAALGCAGFAMERSDTGAAQALTGGMLTCSAECAMILVLNLFDRRSDTVTDCGTVTCQLRNRVIGVSGV
jgi:hypothetical protein